MNLEQLNNPVTKQDIANFQQSHEDPRNRGFFLFRSLNLTDKNLYLFIGLGTTVAIVAAAISTFLQDPRLSMTVIAIGVCLPLFISIYVFARQNAAKEAVSSLKISRVAESNGWGYVRAADNLAYRASLFSAGRNYEFSNIVISPLFEVGQVQFITGSGRSQQTHRYGYMKLPLERSLPHMLLDGKSNNSRAFGIDISNLPMAFNRNQIDALEGDFNKYYTLYAPEDYGSDARYVFTPDLMQLLIQESDNIDIEIIDNELYVYFGNYAMDTEAFWQKVARLQSQLGNKLVERAGQRYTDDRTVDGTVAKQGVRLKQGVSVFVIIVFVIYGLKIVIELLSSLSR